MSPRATAILVLALCLALGRPAFADEAPDPEVFELALTGYQRVVDAGEVQSGSLLTIIDYSLPSTERRLFVYDPAAREVLQASLVAHGKNSGQNMALKFGNEPGSLRSSLGFFVTGETYQGRHGYTLRLRGLEAGFNDNAGERSIVIHGANYVSDKFAERYGRIGRSWGCPALPVATSREIIDLIKGGTCLFVYGPDSTYLDESAYIGREKP